MSGDATWQALKSAVDNLKRTAPQDQDIVLRIDNLTIFEARFLEPHTFLFEGIDQNGHRAGIVVHYTQAVVSVVFCPKDSPTSPVLSRALPRSDFMAINNLRKHYRKPAVAGLLILAWAW